MSEIAVLSLAPSDVVARRLGREWIGEFEVAVVGETPDIVSISSASAVAFDQARSALSAFVRNTDEAWEQAFADGLRTGRFSIALEQPQDKEYPEGIVDWFSSGPRE